jgi:hypothetical protein
MLMRAKSKNIDATIFDALSVDTTNHSLHRLLRNWDILYRQKKHEAAQNTGWFRQ